MCHSPGKVFNGCNEARRGEHVRPVRSTDRAELWNPVQQRPELARSIVYGGVGFLGKKLVKLIKNKLAYFC